MKNDFSEIKNMKLDDKDIRWTLTKEEHRKPVVKDNKKLLVHKDK